MKSFKDYDKEQQQVDEAKGLEGTLRKFIPGYGKRMALDRNAAHWEVVHQMSVAKKEPEDKVRAKSLRHFKAAQKYSNILSQHTLPEEVKACWKGYTAVGTKEKNGRTVPNCVPTKEEVEQIDENWHKQPLNVLYKAHASFSHAPKHDNYDRHLKAIESAVEKKHGKNELQKMKQHSSSPKSAWYAKSKLPEEVEIDEAAPHGMSDREYARHELGKAKKPEVKVGAKVSVTGGGSGVVQKIYDKELHNGQKRKFIHLKDRQGRDFHHRYYAHRVRVLEEVEQTDEGIKDTLKKFATKASVAVATSRANPVTYGIRKGLGQSHDEFKKNVKYAAGIEEEQIDEISKDMATRYMKQIERQPGLDKDHPDKRKPSRFGSQKVGYERAFNKVSPYGRRVKVKATESVEQIDEDKAQYRYTGGMHGEYHPTKKQSSPAAHIDAAKFHEREAKIYSKALGKKGGDDEYANRAIDFHTSAANHHRNSASDMKESVEQIDELSKKTLDSYEDKARMDQNHTLGIALRKYSSPEERAKYKAIADKRGKGRDLALAKLSPKGTRLYSDRTVAKQAKVVATEEVQIDEDKAQYRYTGGMHGEYHPTKKQSSPAAHIDAAKFHEREAKIYSKALGKKGGDDEYANRAIDFHTGAASHHRNSASAMKKSVEQIDEAPAWQRKEGKNPEGGLNQKGVDSYRAENPGSKLQTAVTTEPSKLKKGSKAAKRRLSFCRRMKGMKEKLTSAETARDPDSRINKSLRKWNC